ncbi:E3 ubiquitin ligase PARAQUAT TOLERANCE 3 [Linum perenne]
MPSAEVTSPPPAAATLRLFFHISSVLIHSCILHPDERNHDPINPFPSSWIHGISFPPMCNYISLIQFASSKEYSEIPISGGREYISGMELKMAILRSKYKAKKGADPRKNPDDLCFGTDLDFLITNAQTNDEYNEDALIPTETCVLIRQVPGDRRRRWIDTSPISLVGEAKESSSESEESSVTPDPDCK